MDNDIALKATDLFDDEYNCAQAVFKASIDHKDIKIDRATDIAAGFGGGITYSGQQCGAISGALMAIGTILGKEKSDIMDHKRRTYTVAKELQKGFKEKFGDIICDALTEIDMSDDDLRKKVASEGYFMEICPKFVSWCAAAVLSLTEKYGNPQENL